MENRSGAITDEVHKKIDRKKIYILNTFGKV